MRIAAYKLMLVRDASVKLTPEQITSPMAVEALVKQYLASLDREHFVVVALNTRLQPVGINTVAVGTLDAAMVTGREVFKFAIMANASSIILAHNHPSGDPAPSPDDIAMTKGLKQAGDLLQIAVLDHLIVGETEVISLKEKGII